MAGRPWLYAVCGFTLLGTWINESKLDTLEEKVDSNIQVNKKILEGINKNHKIYEKNIVGNETPEKFYVVKGDTAVFEYDGKPVTEYFKMVGGQE